MRAIRGRVGEGDGERRTDSRIRGNLAGDKLGCFAIIKLVFRIRERSIFLPNFLETQ